MQLPNGFGRSGRAETKRSWPAPCRRSPCHRPAVALPTQGQGLETASHQGGAAHLPIPAPCRRREGRGAGDRWLAGSAGDGSLVGWRKGKM